MKDILNRDFIENFIKIYKVTIVKVGVGIFILTLAFFVFVERNGDGEEFQLAKKEKSEITERSSVYDSSNREERKSEDDSLKEEIYVDISGAVNKPYVYKLPARSRMYELVKMAGGFRDDADTDSLNLAKLLTDQEKVVVYTKKEVMEMAESGGIAPITQISGTGSNSGAAEKININTATAEQLQNLKGVGPSTAEKIISYRNSNGSFRKIEDLMNVKGIGNKTFEKFKDQLCI